MIKKIINIFLIVFLGSFAGYYVWKNTSLSATYYYNKGKQLYQSQLYEESLEMFEQAIKSSPNNQAYRYFYAASLSKMKPTYDVQEKLYKIAHSKTKDLAQEFAKSYIISLKNNLLDGLEENYIINAISNRDIIRWNIEDFPLKVYVEKPNDIPKYYIENILFALSEWEKRTGFIKFQQVLKEKDSNISILFNNYTRSCEGKNCQYVVATTEHSINKDNELEKMTISFYKTNPFGDKYYNTEIQHAALHEIGHALGIMGHSDNKDDIMYSNNDKLFDLFSIYRPQLLNFSMRDIKTIVLLYRLYPTITNSKIKDKENYYYAPLILGEDDELLQSKLSEYQRYIQAYPNFSGGYINISTVYSNLGENDKALEALNTAEKLLTNDNERFLIEHNRAMVYYNMQNFQQSRLHANNALKIKKDKNLEDLINELDRISK